MVKSFTGEYRFLSNFYPCRIEFEGRHYTTVEHAYQAAKTLDDGERLKISFLETPGKAKRYGNTISLREDWESVKLPIMEDLVRKKFQSHELVSLLLNKTGKEELVEGNTWGDVYWGVCDGVGKNHLGKILMKVREEIEERIRI